jgi:hypothetical protein
MSHHHPDHAPSSHHHPAAGDEPTSLQKLAVLLEHWVKHHEDHARTYREWAQTAAALSMPAVRAHLEEAAELTLAANRQFEAALRRVRQKV